MLNSVFLHHCVEAGLDLAMVNPNHITPYAEISENERELADDLVYNRREDALERFIAHFESKGAEDAEEAGDPTEGMEPEEALHWHILRRKKDGVEDWIDRSVEKIGAVPTLNQVLLPAMKEVGDKFGAGELILPFVLQSAEVMKRAVAQLENYLDRIEGHTKGKVVIATVFGDVHDIGKSLVNTILTNNGYTVVDLGKQVPIDTIIDAAVEHEADAIGLSALLVSTSKQMPACIQELHQRGLEFPVLIGGAAINRDFGRRVLYPHGKESDEVYEPGVFYCKDAFAGLDTVDALVDEAARESLVAKIRDEAHELRNRPVEEDTRPADHRRLGALVRAHRQPGPRRRRSGARARSRSTSTRSIPTSIATCCSSSTGAGAATRARTGAGSSRATTATRASRPKLERMWREQDYLHPRARLGYFPCNSDGNELVIFDPDDHDREIERLVFPRQPRHDRICLADFYRPLDDSGERDVVALQAVTVGPEVTERITQLEAEGEFAEQLFTHGLGVQAAEGLAEWLHAEVRRELGIDLDQGRRYSWGYPACPGPVRAREGRAPARPRRDRDHALRRPRARARAVDGGDHRPPPAGGLLRDEVRLRPGGEEGRRADRRHRARRRAAARRGRRGRRHRSRRRPTSPRWTRDGEPHPLPAPARARTSYGSLSARRPAAEPPGRGRGRPGARPGRSRSCRSRSPAAGPRVVGDLGAQHRDAVVAAVEGRFADHVALARRAQVVDRDPDRRDPLAALALDPERRAHRVVDHRVGDRAREQARRVDQLGAHGQPDPGRGLPAQAEPAGEAVDAAVLVVHGANPIRRP